MRRAAALVAVAAAATAQQVGTQTQENHPQLQLSTCTKAGGCTAEQKAVTVDANWRWTHTVGGTTNCFKGNAWNESLCPDGKTCAANCAIEGADKEYEGTYGVKASGDALTLDFVTQGPYSKNVGSRNYMLDDASTYKLFKLKNKEFTFDVDVSNLACGLNGALYFVAMDADGGMSQHPTNKAGAKYGTGYCDAQCPHDVKFINGEANCESWQPSKTDSNSGMGKYGSCCQEMDIWESNKWATAFTPHSCSTNGATRCSGVDCGDNGPDRFNGVCDKNGCDFQTYRLGDKGFFGPGANWTLDSSKKMTVVTQFITADGTDTGALSEIRRSYVQDGKVINTPSLSVGGKTFDSVSTDYCQAEVGLYKDNTTFLAKGGMKSMGDAMEKGMVLVLSLWDDHGVNMLWLDSTYPTTGGPGAARGPCATSSGVPKDIESSDPGASVTFSSIKFGEIGSTTSTQPAPSPPTPPSPSPAPPGPTPPAPSGCPGGSLAGCMGLCPATPTAAYKACVTDCASRCA